MGLCAGRVPVGRGHIRMLQRPEHPLSHRGEERRGWTLTADRCCTWPRHAHTHARIHTHAHTRAHAHTHRHTPPAQSPPESAEHPPFDHLKFNQATFCGFHPRTLHALTHSLIN